MAVEGAGRLLSQWSPEDACDPVIALAEQNLVAELKFGVFVMEGQLDI